MDKSADFNTYTYKANGEVIFTCNAFDILQADKMLLETQGIIASKSPHVSCSISPWKGTEDEAAVLS